MSVPQRSNASTQSLGPQNSVWLNLTGGAAFLNAYTGTGIPAAPAAQYIVTDGLNGAIMWEIIENNVAGGATVTIEGSYDPVVGNWYNLGYYTIVSAGTTQTSLSRAQGALSITQNKQYVLQTLDAYPYMRAYVSANASNASLTVNVYGLAC
jgi:hypothetical protein